MAKWERGSNVREEGQQVVRWRLQKHKKNGTGQVHKMNKWLIGKGAGGLMRREALALQAQNLDR